jgi:RAD54-like protein 2
MKSYIPDALENGGKMVILFNIIEETIRAGEKLLVFRYDI